MTYSASIVKTPDYSVEISMSKSYLPVILKHKYVGHSLRDEFPETLAAGAVNGTLALGSGTAAQRTRTVLDTLSHLSLGNGLATYVTGAAAAEIFYGAHARVAGRFMVCELNVTTTSLDFQWDNNTDATPLEGIRVNETTFTFIDNASGVTGLGPTLVAGTYYKLAIVLRAAGFYAYFKGGIYTKWTLIYIAKSNSTANLIPAVGGTGGGNCKFIRVPQTIYLPHVLAYDTFTRANGAIGSSETAGPEAQVLTAKAWTGATWTIAGNKAVNTPVLGAEQATGALVVGTWYIITATEVDHFYTGCAVGDTFRATATTALDANNKVKAFTTSELFASIDGGVADVVASVDIVGTSQYQEGIVVNLDSAANPQNYIHAYFDRNIGAGTTRLMLDECVNGTITNKIAVTNGTYASGGRLWLIRDGTTCIMVYQNTKVGTTQTMTANTNTRVGLSSTGGATTTHDNFLVMPRGTNGEFTELDRYVHP